MSHHPISSPYDEPIDPVVARFLAPVGGEPDDDNWPTPDPEPAACAEPGLADPEFAGPEHASREFAGPDFNGPPADPAPGRPLSPRQEAFADAYARSPNGAAAARAAGYATASAKIAAARNLRRSGVVLRIVARRREQAQAREAQRARVAGLLEEALAFGRARENGNVLARVAGLTMRLEGLNTVSRADDRLLTDATDEQLESLLACYELASGIGDTEVPHPTSATIEELAERAAELMRMASDKARYLPGALTADRYLAGLRGHLNRAVEDAAEACAFARMVDEAAARSGGLPEPWEAASWPAEWMSGGEAYDGEAYDREAYNGEAFDPEPTGPETAGLAPADPEIADPEIADREPAGHEPADHAPASLGSADADAAGPASTDGQASVAPIGGMPAHREAPDREAACRPAARPAPSPPSTGPGDAAARRRQMITFDNL